MVCNICWRIALLLLLWTSLVSGFAVLLVNFLVGLIKSLLLGLVGSKLALLGLVWPDSPTTIVAALPYRSLSLLVTFSDFIFLWFYR